MIGITSHCKFIKRPAYLVLITGMITMQHIAKRTFPSFSERLKGVVTKNFLGLRPVLRTPLVMNFIHQTLFLFQLNASFVDTKNHERMLSQRKKPRGISLLKISYTSGKNPFALKKNPSKIRTNPFVLKKSRTIFQ